MGYAPLNVYSTYQEDFYTFNNLLALCHQYPDYRFKFIDTDYSVDTIISWRGSYCLPAILASDNVKTGSEIADMIYREIEEVHYGYKGGEYYYSLDDEFYVVTCTSISSEHAVNGFKVEGDTVWLITNINSY